MQSIEEYFSESIRLANSVHKEERLLGKEMIWAYLSNFINMEVSLDENPEDDNAEAIRENLISNIIQDRDQSSEILYFILLCLREVERGEDPRLIFSHSDATSGNQANGQEKILIARRIVALLKNRTCSTIDAAELTAAEEFGKSQRTVRSYFNKYRDVAQFLEGYEVTNRRGRPRN